MEIEQIYTGCLAQGAYYITSKGEATIIDPLRDIQPYIDRLEKDGVQLKYIFESHFHADFVSGHLDLSNRTEAPIVYGPTAQMGFNAIVAEDGQLFRVGDVVIRLLHTPGHTLESSCFLLIDEKGKETALFSGDTLFLGDVGRPDLAQKAANMTKEELAGLLYDSLYNKIIPLADDIIVYPAHGSGSACGKNMMKETVDELGNQKKINYALNQPDKASFIKAVTDGLLPPPAYFGANVTMNKQGYDSFDNILDNSLIALTPDEFERIANDSGALILDTRTDSEFSRKFIPRSINIGLAGDFAPWAGTLIVDVKQPVLLVTEEGDEVEAIKRLSRVGFDKVLGYLQGGVAAWGNKGKETDSITRISPGRFKQELQTGRHNVLDVRKETEYAAGHIEGACNKPLAYIHEWIEDINPEEHFYLHCAGGYRSMIAASILHARGYRNFSEVEGGFNAVSQIAIT